MFRLCSEMTYGMIISSSSLRDCMVLLKCFSFALNENALGNSNPGKLWRVFPTEINCISKNWLYVWSILINIDDGIWYFSTRSTIWWCIVRAASFLACSGISGFEVVFARVTKPILRNRLFIHNKFSRSRAFRCSRSLLAMRAFAVAMVTTELRTPPFLLTIFRKLHTSSSTVSNIRGLPYFKVPISYWHLTPFSLDPGIFCVVLMLGFLQISNEDETF